MRARCERFVDALFTDPQTKSTIRLSLDEGESVLIPAGALHHYNLDNRDGNLRMWAMYKVCDTIYMHGRRAH